MGRDLGTSANILHGKGFHCSMPLVKCTCATAEAPGAADTAEV